MKRILLITVCAASISASAAPAQTAWIEDSLSEMCSAASRAEVANMTRQSIEESVARAHSSIRVPAPIEDLSCLNDLMQAPIDIFSRGGKFLSGFNLTNLVNSVTSGLKAGFSLEKLSEGVEAAICKFAKEKFNELTGGLTGTMDEILGGANMSNFFDNFDKSSTPGSSGSGGGGSTPTDTPQAPAGGIDITDGGSGTPTDNQGFVVPLSELDFAAGGNFAFAEKTSDGNYLPNGGIVIKGNQLPNEQLSFDATPLFDNDGIQRDTATVQWYIDGEPYPFATGPTFGSDRVGSVVSVEYTYTDGRGKVHSVMSNGITILSRSDFDAAGLEYVERDIPNNPFNSATGAGAGTPNTSSSPAPQDQQPQALQRIWNSIGGNQ